MREMEPETPSQITQPLFARVAACQVAAEGFGVFRSSSSNRRKVLKSFRMRPLAATGDESLSSL